MDTLKIKAQIIQHILTTDNDQELIFLNECILPIRSNNQPFEITPQIEALLLKSRNQSDRGLVINHEDALIDLKKCLKVID